MFLQDQQESNIPLGAITNPTIMCCPFTYFFCISFYRHISKNYLVQYASSGFTKPSASQISPMVLQNTIISNEAVFFRI
jgi:hypothetical protein